MIFNFYSGGWLLLLVIVIGGYRIIIFPEIQDEGFTKTSTFACQIISMTILFQKCALNAGSCL